MGEPNMNPEKGGNTFGIARGRVKAPECPPPLPVVTTPDRPGRKKDTAPKPRIGRKTRIAAALLAAEITGGVINEQINDLPVSASTLVQDAAWPWNLGKSVVEDVRGLFNKETPVSPSFNNRLDKQVVAVGINAKPLAEDETLPITHIVPSQDSHYPILNDILFPVILQKNDRVTITKKHGITDFVHMETGERFKKPPYVVGYDLGINRKGTQLIIGTLDKEAKTIEVYKRPLRLVDGQLYLTGILAKITRNDGSRYDVSIISSGYFNALPVLDDAPQLEQELIDERDHKRLVYKGLGLDQPGKIISPTQPLVKTPVGGLIIMYHITSVKSAEGEDFNFEDLNFNLAENNIRYLPQK